MAKVRGSLQLLWAVILSVFLLTGVASDSLTTAHSTGSPLCRDLDSLECGAASDAYSSLHPDTGQTKQPLQFSSDRGFVTVSADSSIANIHAVAAQVEALHSFDRVRSSTKSTATADTQLSEEIPAVLTETATASAATWRDGPSTKELSKHALLLASTADDCSYHVQLIHATPSHIPVSNASQPGMCAVPWMPQAYVGQPQHAVSGHASAVQALWRLVQQVNKDAGAIASSVRDGLASSCYPAADNHLRGLLSVLHWVLQARLHLLGTLCMRPIMAAVLLTFAIGLSLCGSRTRPSAGPVCLTSGPDAALAKKKAAGVGTTLLRQVSNRISAGVFAGYTPEVNPSTPTPSQPIQGAESILPRHAGVMSEAASTFDEAPPADHVKQPSHNHTDALPQQQLQTLPDPQHESSFQQESSDSRFSRKQQLADSAKQHTAALAEGSAHTAPDRPKSVLSEASEQEAINNAADLQQSQGKLQGPAGAPADSPAVEQVSLAPLGKSGLPEIWDGIFGDIDADDTKQAPVVDSAYVSQNSNSPADDDLLSVPDADDEDAWDFDRAQYPQQEVRPDETVDFDDYDSDADGDGSDSECTPESLALALANFLAMRSYAVDGAGEDSLDEEEEAAAESLRVASVHWVGISIVDRQALANPPVGDPQDPANKEEDPKELTDLKPGDVQGSSQSALPHSGPALPAGGPDGINSPEAAVETALPHNSGGLSNAESQGTTLGSAVAVSQPSNAVAQIRHARQVSKFMKGQKSGKALVSGLPTCDEDNEEVVSDAVQDDGVVRGVVSEQQAEAVLVNEDLAVHNVKQEAEAVHNSVPPAVKIFVEDGGRVGRRKKKNMKKQSWLGSVFCCGCSSTK